MPDCRRSPRPADLPGYDAAAWIGYVAPAGTPRELMARVWPAKCRRLQATDELKERLLTLGLDARSSTPEEMGDFMKREQERYGSIIKSAEHQGGAVGSNASRSDACAVRSGAEILGVDLSKDNS